MADLCGLLREAGLEQFAGAAAASSTDLRELAQLALTDPPKVRSWLKAELGVVKLGHRERILNALRRVPATALVALDAPATADSTVRQLGGTGVFIGDSALLRPLPAVGEAGMRVGDWTLAEATDKNSGVGDCLLCSHASGTQVVFASQGGQGGGVWVRHRGKQRTVAMTRASQLLGRFSSGARVSLASGAVTPAVVPCASRFGRLESGSRRPLGEGSFRWVDGRQILASMPGMQLGITALPQAGTGQYAAGPLVWLSPDGGLTLHDGRNRRLQLHAPLLDASTFAHRRLAWARSSEPLPTCIRAAVANRLGAAVSYLASVRVHMAEAALAGSRIVQLAEGGCCASSAGDDDVALKSYLAAADWIEWMGGEAALHHASAKLLLGVREGLQRATARAVVAAAVVRASGLGPGPAREIGSRTRRPCWVWPIPQHKLQHQRGLAENEADARDYECREGTGTGGLGSIEATICQRCFLEDPTGCTINMRTGDHLCAVCSGDRLDLHAASQSKAAVLESVLATEIEQPSHFAMLSCYEGRMPGSAEPLLIHQWRRPGVCACCGRCGPLALSRQRPANTTGKRMHRGDAPSQPVLSPTSASDFVVPIPPPMDRFTSSFLQARNGVVCGSDAEPIRLGTTSSVAWVFGHWLVQYAPRTPHRRQSSNIGLHVANDNNGSETDDDEIDDEGEHDDSSGVQQLMLAHSDGTRLTVIIFPPLAAENNRTTAASIRRQRDYDQHRRLQNELFGSAQQQRQRRYRLNPSRTSSTAYIFCTHASGSTSVTMASTGLTRTLDLTTANDQKLQPTATVDPGPTVVRLPGGRYSWQWRGAGRVSETKSVSRSRHDPTGPGSTWQQRRQSVPWQPEEGGGSHRSADLPPKSLRKQNSEKDMAILHVCEHSSRLQLFGGDIGGKDTGASLFLTDDGTVALHISAIKSSKDSGSATASGVYRYACAEALFRPAQFLHVSLQLPVAQRVAWATLLLSSAGNIGSIAHRLLSPDLIELVGRKVSNATDHSEDRKQSERSPPPGPAHGSANSSIGASGGWQDYFAEVRRRESPAVPTAPAVRSVVERLWRRSCWWSDFYLAEESAAELSRALHHQGMDPNELRWLWFRLMKWLHSCSCGR